MGFDLIDLKNKEDGFSTNIWHWHVIVGIIRSLRVLPEEKVDSLNEQYTDKGLSAEEARIVAAEMRSQVLPMLDQHSRVYFDGSTVRTDIPHDNVHYTTQAVLQRFVDYCERSSGFALW